MKKITPRGLLRALMLANDRKSYPDAYINEIDLDDVIVDGRIDFEVLPSTLTK